MKKLVIATFNVNSIRARAGLLSRWLERVALDVLCLQETKVGDQLFPYQLFERLGLQCAVFGQKGYNGVAICSREPIEGVSLGFGGDGDEERRLLAGVVGGLRIVNVYVPHGDEPGTQKYRRKLKFFAELRGYLDANYHSGQPLLVLGDMNVARTDADVWDAQALNGVIGTLPGERQAFEGLLQWGLIDLYRARHPQGRAFTWWDYRTAGVWRDEGMRIDYILATDTVAARCECIEVDMWPRRRRRPTPSDHAPVVARFSWP